MFRRLAYLEDLGFCLAFGMMLINGEWGNK